MLKGKHLDDFMKHEDIVHSIVARLEASGRYDYIQVHVEEKRTLLNGGYELVAEQDIIAGNKHSLHYYEIKCRDNRASRKHADRQFKRYDLRHPGLNAKFIYITEDSCKRIYLRGPHA